MRKTPETTKAQVGHFLQISRKGSSKFFLKFFFPKIADLREKVHISRSLRSYEIMFFLSSKTLILMKISDFSILNHVVDSRVFRTNMVNLWLKSLKEMRCLSGFEWNRVKSSQIKWNRLFVRVDENQDFCDFFDFGSSFSMNFNAFFF